MAATEVIPYFERLKEATRALITLKTCTEQGTRQRYEAKLKASCGTVSAPVCHISTFICFLLII